VYYSSSESMHHLSAGMYPPNLHDTPDDVHRFHVLCHNSHDPERSCHCSTRAPQPLLQHAEGVDREHTWQYSLRVGVGVAFVPEYWPLYIVLRVPRVYSTWSA
jgi:hypothetical protein